MMSPSKWYRCLLLLFLFCTEVARGDFYRQLSNRSWRNRGSGLTRASTPEPHTLADSSLRGARPPTNSDVMSRGQYFHRLVNRLGRNRREKFSKKREFAPRSGVPSPSVLSSSTDLPVPPELAAIIPPGGTIEDIPKSALAVLTGDPDYTRFRQLFLRQMCQRLLNGSRSDLFQFCFSILAL